MKNADVWPLLFLIFVSSAVGAVAQERLGIPLGFSHLVNAERAVESIFVGNSEIVDVQAVSDRSVALTGKGVGQTNLILVDQNGEEFFSAIVNIFPQGPQQSRVRVIEGGSDQDGVLYVCKPARGCTPLRQGGPDPTESTLIEGIAQAERQLETTTDTLPQSTGNINEDAE